MPPFPPGPRVQTVLYADRSRYPKIRSWRTLGGVDNICELDPIEISKVAVAGVESDPESNIMELVIS